MHECESMNHSASPPTQSGSEATLQEWWFKASSSHFAVKGPHAARDTAALKRLARASTGRTRESDLRFLACFASRPSWSLKSAMHFVDRYSPSKRRSDPPVRPVLARS